MGEDAANLRLRGNAAIWRLQPASCIVIDRTILIRRAIQKASLALDPSLPTVYTPPVDDPVHQNQHM